MLLELITGQRAFDLARLANDDDVMLLDWVCTLYYVLIVFYFFVEVLSFCLFHKASEQ
jgi:hypothetical protein